MSRDAKLNDLIRLKRTPAAPVERWQMMPTKQNQSLSAIPSHVSNGSLCSPLRCTTNTHTAKTPENSRLVIKYKKTPKVKSPTNYKTPKHKSTNSNVPKKASPPKSTKKTPSNTPGCRYIPNRSTTDMDYSSFLVRKGHKDGDSVNEENSPGTEAYRESLLQAMSQGKRRQRGVLSFSTTPSQKGNNSSYMSSSSALRSCNRRSMKKTPKRLITSAEKILDAPSIEDDYYLNNLDWSKNNQVAIGLGSAVFLWNAITGSVEQLMEMSGQSYVSSLSWAGNGKYLAIGGSNAAIHLWDVEKGKRLRLMKGHSDRVGVLAWNRHNLTSGCRDGEIHHHDVRKPEHIVAMSKYHHLEVCGLQWSQDGSRLASGANDNLVCIWNAGDPSEPSKVLRGHQAAVKAVSWCPWQTNTLATGGGSSDQTIRFWNVFTGECVNSIGTKSQVSALAWNKYHRQLISAHGGPKHQMSVWNFPSLTKTGELLGHEGRVLHMCLSPKKSSVASAAADETLRIWKAFDEPDLETSQRTYSEDSISALLQSFNN